MCCKNNEFSLIHCFFYFLIDILKETPKTQRDHDLLSKAIGSLKEVMTHINEDKRKIENQLAMFVLINDIELANL